MNEYQILIKSLKSTIGISTTEKILEQFKVVVKENNLDRSEKMLHDFLRLIEIEFTHQ